MGLESMLDKLSIIVTKPIELATEWAREPLRKKAHERELERGRAQITTESELKMKEMKFESDLRAKEKEHDVDLSIKQQTEVKRIYLELEEFKKDKELARMVAVSEAIMKYQVELTKLNVNAINAIGNMQLDLREKAQQLVYGKTIKYKELQDQAINEAADDLKRIESNFSENSIATGILIRAVDKRLANIIDTANNFLLELNADIRVLNQSISILTEHGQNFIESHLDKFHIADSTSSLMNKIES